MTARNEVIFVSKSDPRPLSASVGSFVSSSRSLYTPIQINRWKASTQNCIPSKVLTQFEGLGYNWVVVQIR